MFQRPSLIRAIRTCIFQVGQLESFNAMIPENLTSAIVVLIATYNPTKHCCISNVDLGP